MRSRLFQERGILAKLLEKGIEILLKKECQRISKVEINIIASSLQIIRGAIKNINIIAEDINYKDLLFDGIELDANDVKIIFQINKKEFSIKDNLIIKFKILISENSLKGILLSKRWNWIRSMITEEVLNQNKFNSVKIRNNQILIETIKENNIVNKIEKISLKAKKGKIYLENESYRKSFKVPIEDKVYIKDLNIENDLIMIFAKSSVSF
tara:strand:- start:556 stop:1188 length:633 start_codon:yes stop_codon:yes gene_type:complete